MTIEHLLYFLVIGVVAGFLAGKMMKGSGYGLIGDLILGVIGSIVGGWLFGLAGISIGGVIGTLIAATFGALLVLYVIRFIKSA